MLNISYTASLPCSGKWYLDQTDFEELWNSWCRLLLSAGVAFHFQLPSGQTGTLQKAGIPLPFHNRTHIRQAGCHYHSAGSDHFFHITVSLVVKDPVVIIRVSIMHKLFRKFIPKQPVLRCRYRSAPCSLKSVCWIRLSWNPYAGCARSAS